MMMPIRNKFSVGIDVGSDTLRAVALRHHGVKCEIIAAVESGRTPNHPHPTQLDVQRLVHAMERQGVRIHDAVIGAPSDRLMSSMIELPPRSSGAPIDSLAKAEIAKSIHGSFESYIWDLPESPRQKVTEYFAIAYSHEDAHELLAPFEAEGITISAIEPELTALARVTGSNNRVVLDIGGRGARLYAYARSSVLFARCNPRAEISPDPTSIVRGFMGTIDYLVNRFPDLEDATVVVLGQPHLYEEVKQELLKEFDADVTNKLVVDLTSSSQLQNYSFDSRWASTIGLATRHAVKEVA